MSSHPVKAQLPERAMSELLTFIAPYWKPIASALGTATVGGAGFLIRRWKKGKEPADDDAPAELVDVRGDWLSRTAEDTDRIEITAQSERWVDGKRLYVRAKATERHFSLSGFFDGRFLALAATCNEKGEMRTILARQIDGSTLRGVRTYPLKNGSMAISDERTWKKQ
jgi:hypothetical protein